MIELVYTGYPGPNTTLAPGPRTRHVCAYALSLQDYGIQHGQSSPYNPQSNGHAERNVKITKELLIKTETDVHSKQFLDGIAQIRNRPRADCISPCQMMFGWSILTLLPTLTKALGTNDYIENAIQRKETFDSKQKRRYDKHARVLDPLKPGTKVWVQNVETRKWTEKGTIGENLRKDVIDCWWQMEK